MKTFGKMRPGRLIFAATAETAAPGLLYALAHTARPGIYEKRRTGALLPRHFSTRSALRHRTGHFCTGHFSTRSRHTARPGVSSKAHRCSSASTLLYAARALENAPDSAPFRAFQQAQVRGGGIKPGVVQRAAAAEPPGGLFGDEVLLQA